MARLLPTVLAIPKVGTYQPDTRPGNDQTHLRCLIPAAGMIPLEGPSPVVGMAGMNACEPDSGLRAASPPSEHVTTTIRADEAARKSSSQRPRDVLAALASPPADPPNLQPGGWRRHRPHLGLCPIATNVPFILYIHPSPIVLLSGAIWQVLVQPSSPTGRIEPTYHVIQAIPTFGTLAGGSSLHGRVGPLRVNIPAGHTVRMIRISGINPMVRH